MRRNVLCLLFALSVSAAAEDGGRPRSHQKPVPEESIEGTAIELPWLKSSFSISDDHWSVVRRKEGRVVWVASMQGVCKGLGSGSAEKAYHLYWGRKHPDLISVGLANHCAATLTISNGKTECWGCD